MNVFGKMTEHKEIRMEQKKGSRFLSKTQGIAILLEDYASGKYIRIPKSTVAYTFQIVVWEWKYRLNTKCKPCRSYVGKI